jgi:capsular polysaccharide biosynthesis protein
MADTEAKFSRPRYLLRWAWQRWLTKLPCRVRRFDDIFPGSCDYVGGVFAQRARFTGVLQRESGRPFFVRPTRFLAGHATGLASENTAYWTREPDRIAFAMSGAGIYGNHGRIYDPATRAFVTETSEDWLTAFDRHSALAMPGFPPAARLPGISLMLGTLGGQTFYHFFVETLPKAVFLQAYLQQCDHIIVSRYGEEWKRRWLALWGLEHKAVFVHELSHYVCDQLIFTNRLVRHFEAGPWAVETLRQVPGLSVNRTLNPRGKVLWLDRTRDHMRPVAWENDLLAAMPWVERVRVAELTPAQAAVLFGQARAVLGFHGAAFANMVFCPPGATVVEIFTEPNYPWYARLAQSCGHDHAALAVKNEPASLPGLAALLRGAITG